MIESNAGGGGRGPPGPLPPPHPTPSGYPIRVMACASGESSVALASNRPGAPVAAPPSAGGDGGWPGQRRRRGGTVARACGRALRVRRDRSRRLLGPGRPGSRRARLGPGAGHWHPACASLAGCLVIPSPRCQKRVTGVPAPLAGLPTQTFWVTLTPGQPG